MGLIFLRLSTVGCLPSCRRRTGWSHDLLWATLFSVLRYFHSHLKTVKLSQNSSRKSPAGHWILFLWGAAGGVVEVSLGFLEKAESACLRVMPFHGICFGYFSHITQLNLSCFLETKRLAVIEFSLNCGLPERSGVGALRLLPDDRCDLLGLISTSGIVYPPSIRNDHHIDLVEWNYHQIDGGNLLLGSKRGFARSPVETMVGRATWSKFVQYLQYLRDIMQNIVIAKCAKKLEEIRTKRMQFDALNQV
ncbi:hypothetical protein K438DRAFT_1758157 [Mycena galopus ATCC 62051]|nr:hypothetical protein K438DRAFT_1758157 [Mycena galopus ATCC 62051]